MGPQTGQIKTCKECRERIPLDAKRCKHCGAKTGTSLGQVFGALLILAAAFFVIWLVVQSWTSGI